jgi:hypothetical protein
MLWSDLYGCIVRLVYGYSHAIEFVAGRAFCWRTSDRSARSCRLEDRCGGMIQCGRVERIAEAKVDYKSILPNWGLQRARRAPIIHILIHHGIV